MGAMIFVMQDVVIVDMEEGIVLCSRGYWGYCDCSGDYGDDTVVKADVVDVGMEEDVINRRVT